MTPEGIALAAQRLAGHIRRTPLLPSPRLNSVCGAEIFLKHEYKQVTGSFKERGAANRLLCLSAAERGRGVIAASAGNHALGLAFHGQRLGIAVQVVMPRYAPMVKVAQCRAYGAEVQLVGDSFDEARALAATWADERGLSLVHGFDDPGVIEGQGTLGLELLQDASDLETVVVPVGGGGLLAGVCVALEQRPDIEIVAVEADHARTLAGALAAGQPVVVPVTPGLADGLAVARLGQHCFAPIQGRVSRVEAVGEAEIANAIVQLMDVEKAVVEGAGAVGLAWLLGRPERVKGRRVGVILSGGNIDLNVASRVIERGLAAAQRLCKMDVDVSDHPGSLAHLLSVIASAEANLVQVEHDRHFAPADVTQVNVSLLLETRDGEHIERVRAALDRAGFRFRLRRQ